MQKVSDRGWGFVGISGSTLKILAIVFMFVDHFAAIIVKGWLDRKKIEYMLHPESLEFAYSFYEVLRYIGRISFPIFIFLLVQGVIHTKNVWKYLQRMLLLAIVSEIPFDLAFQLHERHILQGKIMEFESQNIFFTLSIGLCAIIMIKKIQESILPWWIQFVCIGILVILGLYLSIWVRGDYLDFGYLAIIVMYLFRNHRLLGPLLLCSVLALSQKTQLPCFFAVFPIWLYNGKRGCKLKWIFYLFYPIHLFFLWAIALLLGIT